MNNIGSQFYKDMSKYDIGKNRARRKIMNLSIFIAVAVGAAMMYFKMPDILMYLTVAITALPGVIIGMKKDLDMKEKWQFSLQIQERIYQTDEMEVYQANDFIQKKGVSEVANTNRTVAEKRTGLFTKKGN
ncbi:PrgI family protein [Pseudolactococcus carnosus]|uniref:PrgI family protein n=1 Tax=Pseudolactococcus carnosus TaxID=2749961 RepID=A0ABT0AR81_9LACT|nr:PrgI family protein [Lactococcus carnosus]MCJ1989105.1 PrgI family protein [Lactococcus carnosus]